MLVRACSLVVVLFLSGGWLARANGPAEPAGDPFSPGVCQVAESDPPADESAPPAPPDDEAQASQPQATEEKKEEPQAEEEVRRGRHFAALPLVNFDSDDGIGYGAKAAFFNYGEGDKPYDSQLAYQIFFTTKHVQHHEIYLDFPHVHDGPWRIEMKAKYDRYLFSNWFGAGNTAFDSSIFGDIGDPATFSQSDLDKLADYYHSYEQTDPKLIANFRRRLGGAFQLFLGTQVKRVTVDFHTPASIADLEDITIDPGWQSFLEQTMPYGVGGGDVGMAQAGVVYDSRDQESSPQHGAFVELTSRAMYFQAEDDSETVGKEPWYYGANLTARYYFGMGEHLVLATRLVGDFLTGDVPFFDLASFGGLSDYTGLGGSVSLRGVRANTYQGKIKAIATPELRYTPFRFRMFNDDFRLGFVLFSDVGRVFDDGDASVPDSNDYHVGYGTGLRLVWGKDFIVRLDAAKSSSEDVRIYLDFGQVF
jgi:hypothetical protein